MCMKTAERCLLWWPKSLLGIIIPPSLPPGHVARGKAVAAAVERVLLLVVVCALWAQQQQMVWSYIQYTGGEKNGNISTNNI